MFNKDQSINQSINIALGKIQWNVYYTRIPVQRRT